MLARLTNGDKSFSILSLNSQSILAEFTGLQVMLQVFAAHDIHFHAICIQESWIQSESKLPLVALECYQCFSLKSTASSHGGPFTYMDDKHDVSVKTAVDNSNVWEGLFLELNHNSLHNKIIIGNAYKPLKDSNSARNINAYKTEIEPIFQELGANNYEAVICGDYNIDLDERRHSFFWFFNTMVGHNFYPKITLPTR